MMMKGKNKTKTSQEEDGSMEQFTCIFCGLHKDNHHIHIHK